VEENPTSILVVKEFSLIRLRGNEVRAFVNELAELRLKVFWDFPYLYEGIVEYEKKYLATYFKTKKSFMTIRNWI
jgi:hypothetical protein